MAKTGSRRLKKVMREEKTRGIEHKTKQQLILGRVIKATSMEGKSELKMTKALRKPPSGAPL